MDHQGLRALLVVHGFVTLAARPAKRRLSRS
jgi:hypothetical protein